MKIKEILQNSINELNKNKIESSIKKARILLAYVLDVEKEYLVVHDDEEIDKQKEKIYNESICKLIKHIPIQYITNHQEFMKLNFYVDENVLIPRQDTEILVEEVINNCSKNVENAYKILDLCAGSGIVRNITCKIYKKCTSIMHRCK